MKKILLRTEGEHSSVSVLRLVTSNSPHKPITPDEMRRRVRILDALDAVDGDELRLEDEDQKALAAAIEGFPWSSASRDLLTIIDDVLKAEHVKLVKHDSD